MNLTNEQELILENCDQNMYVSASPGSGKSTMLSYICSKLLMDTSNFVMLVTFTNKASKSIISKCENVDQKRVIGGTFHGIVYRLMKANNIEKYICDENKKRLIIKKIFAVKGDKDKYEHIYDIISKAKSKWPMESRDVVTRYNNELKKYNLIDFDDIIYEGIKTFSSIEYNFPRITHLLVDELQDTSKPQLELLKVWQTKTNAKIIGVADDDQNIYNWRGACQENVTDFISHFKCTLFNMGYNFRSSTKIVDHSKKLIENNKKRIEKQIRAFKQDSGIVTDYKCKNPFEEIDYVVMKCQQYKDKKIAILYRNRTFKNHLEFELRKAKIEYTVNDFLEITDRSAIKVMLSVLKICTKEFDLYDLQNAAKAIKGLGNVTVSKIEKESDLGIPASQVFHKHSLDKKKKKRLNSLLILQDFYRKNYENRLENLVREIEKHFNKSFDYADSMRDFLLDISKDYRITSSSIKTLYNELGLNGKEEHNDEGANVELSTVHGYKGLQRNIVIVPWIQQYLENKPGRSIEIEEERRLFYVAITRAESSVYLTYSGNKPQFIKEMKL